MNTQAVEYVAQKQRCGCTVASVAMVTGKCYDEVRAHCAISVDFDKNGVQIEDWLDFLFFNGFTFHRMYSVTHLQGVNRRRDTWPPAPFAPLHLCGVTTAANAHAVVMLGDGRVLDPAWPGFHTLSDYVNTHLVLGLFKRSQ
jgi:hypothetical protein